MNYDNCTINDDYNPLAEVLPDLVGERLAFCLYRIGAQLDGYPAGILFSFFC